MHHESEWASEWKKESGMKTERKKTDSNIEMDMYIWDTSHAPSYDCIAFAQSVPFVLYCVLNCFYLDHQVVHFLHPFRKQQKQQRITSSLSHFRRMGVARVQFDWELIFQLIAINVFPSHIRNGKKSCFLFTLDTFCEFLLLLLLKRIYKIRILISI